MVLYCLAIVNSVVLLAAPWMIAPQVLAGGVDSLENREYLRERAANRFVMTSTPELTEALKELVGRDVVQEIDMTAVLVEMDGGSGEIRGLVSPEFWAAQLVEDERWVAGFKARLESGGKDVKAIEFLKAEGAHEWRANGTLVFQTPTGAAAVDFSLVLWPTNVVGDGARHVLPVGGRHEWSNVRPIAPSDDMLPAGVARGGHA